MSVGLDKQIDRAKTILEESLWPTFNNRIEGRSWVILKNGKNQPYVYLGSNEYDEVLVNDKYDSIIHFHVESTRPRVSSSTFTANVYIMFAVNLKSIYGDDTRAVEKAHLAAINALNYTSFNFDSGDLVTDIDSYSIYDLDTKQQMRFNMQPYYVFRIEATVNYTANTDCAFVEPSTSYEITLSSTEGGAAYSSLGNEGTYTEVPANSIQGFSACEETGYRFKDWLIDGAVSVSYLLNTFGLKINKAYNIVAQFIAQWNLTTSVDGAGTISPASGTYDDGEVIEIVAEPIDPLTTELSEIKVNGTQVATTSPYSLVMENENKDLVAYFLDKYTLTINENTNATVIPDYGIYSKLEGDEVTITAAANSGYNILGIVENGILKSNPLDLIMTENKTINISTQVSVASPLLPNGYFENSIYFGNTKYF